MKDLSYIALIPLLPLIGFLIIGLLNKKLPKALVGVIGSGVILGAFGIVFSLLLQVINKTWTAETITLFDWIQVGNLNLGISFLIDPLSIIMMSIITGVGFLIHIYSIGYMSHDEGYARYFSYLNLFVFSMLLLVMGSNYVLMFAGWEGVGLCSYLLIGFWFKKHAYNNAAKKAFIMNRVGDLGFLLGMLLLYLTFGSLNYADIFPKAASTFGVNDIVVVSITLLLFVGATGKSAQIPLYTWLPDAMAGPTPVSALIHAATMVTAGIYMIVRSNILYTLSPTTLTIIMVIGLATALFAATIGLVQNDIKKVLAYSTVSQLGYMFFALGMGAYTTAMFHLATHAFFKALLFLGSGSVIHAMSNEQDIRSMGGLRKKLPITYLTFLIGTLAIAGIPPFAGFFSKDEILAHAFEKSPLLWGIALAGALMTTFYMFRLLFLTFFGSFRGTEDQKHHLHESPLTMTIPLILLAVLSIVGGFMGVPHVIGHVIGIHQHSLGETLTPIIQQLPNAEPHEALSASTEWLLMGLSVGAVILTIIITAIVYVSKKTVPAPESANLPFFHKLLYNKYYIDELYETLIVKPFYWLSGIFHSILETKVVDGLVNGVGKGVEATGKVLRLAQNGSISFYVMAMVLGMCLIIFVSNWLL